MRNRGGRPSGIDQPDGLADVVPNQRSVPSPRISQY
jgi:hypothetical protein